MALNARQEKFAQLVGVLGLTHAEAAKQAGFSARNPDSLATQLLRKAPVASRIATLRAQQQAKLEAATEGKILSRAAILLLLSKLATEGKTEHAKLKAVELLAKLQGYNEPVPQQVQHLHMHVDAGLIDQLRSGYAALAEREQAKALPAIEKGPVGPQDGYAPPSKGHPPPPPLEGDGTQNNIPPTV